MAWQDRFHRYPAAAGLRTGTKKQGRFMRRFGWIVLLFGLLSMPLACSHWPFSAFQAELIEAENQQVAGCEQVGTLSETVDSGRIITPLARREMVGRLKARATALGATHLVWEYRTDQTAAARAYLCAE
jgi:hypothetical protein